MTEKLDTRLRRAVPLLLRPWDEARIVIVGVGGTGSWLAVQAGRLIRVLEARGKKARLTLVDPDIVEEKNISRQNFCDADLAGDDGKPLHKATSLAFRLSLSWGINVSAITEPFDPHLLEDYPYPSYERSAERLTVVVGAVDNAQARSAIFKVLEANHSFEAPRFFVLDCGNLAAGADGNESGQVLLGSASSPEGMQHAFRIRNACIALPSPALQAPDLLMARQEEGDQSPLSCAEIAQANTQGLMINPMIAMIAAQYLFAMFVTGKLTRFATYVDVHSGTMSSEYITPETLARVISKDPTFFARKER